MKEQLERLAKIQERAGECHCVAAFLSHAVHGISVLDPTVKDIGLGICLAHLGEDLLFLEQRIADVLETYKVEEGS